MFRFIVRYLMSHPQLIETLSNSYPFRRAAQITASLYFRVKGYGSDFTRTLTQEMERRYRQIPQEPSPPGMSAQRSSHSVGRQSDLNIREIEEKLRKLKAYTDELKRKQGR